MNYCKILLFLCCPFNLIYHLSIIFTVYIDIFNAKSKIIKFYSKNNYFSGFVVLASTNEFNKRAVAWFYRNHPYPMIHDWINFLQKFNFQSVPYHEILLIPKDPEQCTTQHIVKIYEITNYHIDYSYNNLRIRIPMSIGTLIPENYIFNHTIYTN
jgi:hypothetical protein